MKIILKDSTPEQAASIHDAIFQHLKAIGYEFRGDQFVCEPDVAMQFRFPHQIKVEIENAGS